MQLLDDEVNLGLVKAIVGINHLLTFIAAPLIFLTIFYKNKIKQYLQLRHFQPIYLLLFPLALFMLYPLMGYLAFFIDKIDFPDFLSQMDADATESLTRLLKMDHPIDLIINLLLISILPGIGEELLFRGIIQKEIYQKWNRPHLAIWVTAFIFAAFHFQIVGFLPKMMIGVVLGYAYFFSGSLILPMVIHAINNGFATVSYYFAGEGTKAENIPDQNIPLGSVIISTMLFALTMYYIYHIYLQSQLAEHE
jgi:membrane protease YdiL (CAAX protease family)